MTCVAYSHLSVPRVTGATTAQALGERPFGTSSTQTGLKVAPQASEEVHRLRSLELLESEKNVHAIDPPSKMMMPFPSVGMLNNAGFVAPDIPAKCADLYEVRLEPSTEQA